MVLPALLGLLVLPRPTGAHESRPGYLELTETEAGTWRVPWKRPINDEVEIRSAESYWGLGALTAEKRLKDDLGEEFQIMTIGPAGEKMVRYACLSHDFGRQAGRSGVTVALPALVELDRGPRPGAGFATHLVEQS